MPKTILIAPLNWGLGHATRCIPIIKGLLENKHEVIVASDGGALELLKREFPDLRAEELPSYKITYPENGSFMWQMAKLLPGILRAIREERKVLEELMTTHAIDVVISDNRFGMYHSSVKSVFITHQIQLKLPFGSGVLALLQNRMIKGFTEVWVPDFSGKINMSGSLSHTSKIPKRAQFMGLLSRFNSETIGVKPDGFSVVDPFVLVVISGPEPQRSIFENKVIQQSEAVSMPVVVVGGNLDSDQDRTTSTLFHFPFLQTDNLAWLIQHSKVLIVRSGYTTIMDLVALQKPAIVVPTPGQTEQEYLAEYLNETGMFYAMNQREFDIDQAIKNYNFLNIKKSFYSEKENSNLMGLLDAI